MLTVLLSEKLPHPALEAVSVSVNVPAVKSAALGEYVGERVVALIKVPVPEEVQSRLDEFIADASFTV